MPRWTFILLVWFAVQAGCDRAPVTETESTPAPRPAATGQRWVVIKAAKLDCATCALGVENELKKIAGVSQIETFAPQPYCRFYVEDAVLDVPAMLDKIAAVDTTLEGWRFVRGG